MEIFDPEENRDDEGVEYTNPKPTETADGHGNRAAQAKPMADILVDPKSTRNLPLKPSLLLL